MSSFVSGCAAAGSERPDQVIAGWYTQDAEQSRLQPCDRSQALELRNTDELRRRAADFDLAPDTPVYVRLEGQQSAESVLVVSKIVQFGSDTPRLDCPMTGVVTGESEG